MTDKSHQHAHGASTLVIFGATGDLTYRKLVPAAYNLYRGAVDDGKEPPLRIIGIGRRDYTKEQYRETLRKGVAEFTRKAFSDEMYDDFARNIDYYRMNIAEAEEYRGLCRYLAEHAAEGNILFYFAVAPKLFTPIAEGISGFLDVNPRNRIIIEKPFGENLKQAEALKERIAAACGEEAIYRIDHYLGKEMIQNIHTLRFENKLFRRAWDRESIEWIEITAAEKVGVETRGAYYDAAGTMRDMVQNHLFQILSIIAMEEPETDDPEDFMRGQWKALESLRPASFDEDRAQLILGQYRGYREVPNVVRDSETDTYAAVCCHIDNERWRGVPFFIRTGKSLGKRCTYVVINFRKTHPDCERDRIIFEIQPTEGVRLRFNIKNPGLTNEVIPVMMDFCQSCDIEYASNTPEAYERLLMAADQGKREMFSQWPQIEVSWSWVDRLMEKYRELGLKPFEYEPGSDGPREAHELTARYGAEWYDFLGDQCDKGGKA